jgi:very-short-patch-repair endonuclease
MQAPDRTRAFARALRREMTLPEVVLWQVLRGRRLQGLKFRRQHALGPFILDFYCDEARLAVEVDGALHADQGSGQYDAERDAYVARYGVRTLRLSATVVLKDMTSACEAILAAVADAGGNPLRQSLRDCHLPRTGPAGLGEE